MERKIRIRIGNKRVAIAAFSLLIFGSLMIASAEMGNSAGDTSYLTGVVVRQLIYALAGIVVYMVLCNLRVQRMPLFFAWFFMMHEEDINKPKIIILTMILSAIPLILIESEPDLSTTIVTMMIICVMMFVVGLSYKLVGAVLGVSVPTLVILLALIARDGQTILKEYQGVRILAWLKPDKYPQNSYQQQNSIMAIGSGQLMGKGLGNDAFDSVKNGNYISEPHTDFIFAVAGEELGFVGSALIILLIFFITIEILMIAKNAKDISGKLICVGMATLIGFQSFVNICVVTGLMPNTGLPLPFVSYGLTSLVTIYFGIGIVLNVGLQSNNKNGRLF